LKQRYETDKEYDIKINAIDITESFSFWWNDWLVWVFTVFFMQLRSFAGLNKQQSVFF